MYEPELLGPCSAWRGQSCRECAFAKGGSSVGSVALLDQKEQSQWIELSFQAGWVVLVSVGYSCWSLSLLSRSPSEVLLEAVGWLLELDGAVGVSWHGKHTGGGQC